MKHLLVLSHCILNHAAKVEQDESELQDEYRVRAELLRLILEKDVQMIQLPCPEFLMYGSQRWGHVRNQFEHPYYIAQCRKLLETTLLQLEEYSQHPESFHLMGIVSVEGSPNCGYRLTCVGSKWKGEIGEDPKHVEEIQHSLRMVDEPGVYMKLLENELNERQLSIPIITMDEAVQAVKLL